MFNFYFWVYYTFNKFADAFERLSSQLNLIQSNYEMCITVYWKEIAKVDNQLETFKLYWLYSLTYKIGFVNHSKAHFSNHWTCISLPVSLSSSLFFTSHMHFITFYRHENSTCNFWRALSIAYSTQTSKKGLSKHLILLAIWRGEVIQPRLAKKKSVADLLFLCHISHLCWVWITRGNTCPVRGLLMWQKYLKWQ